MKKRIEIEFSENELGEVAEANLNALFEKAIVDATTYADIKKVSIDGNVFWLKEKHA